MRRNIHDNPRPRMDQHRGLALNWTMQNDPRLHNHTPAPDRTRARHRYRYRTFIAPIPLLPCFVLLLTACATTPAPTDSAAPAIAAANEFREALAREDFGAALALVADDFTSTQWRTREDLRVYLVQARDRGYYAPATLAVESPQGTVISDVVRVYPVGLRTRAGVAVFDLTCAERAGEWKVVSAALEFY